MDKHEPEDTGDIAKIADGVDCYAPRVPDFIEEASMNTELKTMPNSVPNETGFYWARSESYKWFNLIVEVYGDSPFLRLRAWHLFNQTIISLESWSIKEWGPKIERPEQ